MATTTTTRKPRKTTAAAVKAAAPDKTEDQPADEPMFREDRIRLAAYKLSQARPVGQEDPLADWLEAEAEIDSQDAD